LTEIICEDILKNMIQTGTESETPGPYRDASEGNQGKRNDPKCVERTVIREIQPVVEVFERRSGRCHIGDGKPIARHFGVAGRIPAYQAANREEEWLTWRV